MRLYHIFFEHPGGGTDWLAIHAADSTEARTFFHQRSLYTYATIIKVEEAHPQGQPERD